MMPNAIPSLEAAIAVGRGSSESRLRPNWNSLIWLEIPFINQL